MSLIVEYYSSGLLFVLQSLFFFKCSLDKKSFLNKKIIILIVFFAAILDALVMFYIDGVLKNLLGISVVVLIYMIFLNQYIL